MSHGSPSHHEYDGLNRRVSKRRIKRVEAVDGDKKAPISSQETGECGVRVGWGSFRDNCFDVPIR